MLYSQCMVTYRNILSRLEMYGDTSMKDSAIEFHGYVNSVTNIDRISTYLLGLIF